METFIKPTVFIKCQFQNTKQLVIFLTDRNFFMPSTLLLKKTFSFIILSAPSASK
jgi:hypothetical protein